LDQLGSERSHQTIEVKKVGRSEHLPELLPGTAEQFRNDHVGNIGTKRALVGCFRHRRPRGDVPRIREHDVKHVAQQ
jgi:hypothetical protein